MGMTDGKIVRIVGFGLPLSTVLAALGVGALYGAGTAILILAGGVLLGVVAIMWASVRTLSGDSPITLKKPSPWKAARSRRAETVRRRKDLE
jgi:hypothetical protein